MRVLCIDNSVHESTPKGYESDLKLIEEGNEYLVLKVEVSGGFILDGIKGKNPLGYKPCRFVPVSDIDETEMERNYIKEKV